MECLLCGADDAHIARIRLGRSDYLTLNAIPLMAC